MEAFIPREKGCMLDCLDWVPNRGACIDACFVWWRDTFLSASRYKALRKNVKINTKQFLYTSIYALLRNQPL